MAVPAYGRNSALLQISRWGPPIWGWYLLRTACLMLCSELPQDDDCCSAAWRPHRMRQPRCRPPAGGRIRCWELMLASAASFILFRVRAAVSQGCLQYEGYGRLGACRQGIIDACACFSGMAAPA